jgi:hypothetical protein
VEATAGLSDAAHASAGFAISFARHLNRRVGRKGKVFWADRHHRRDLPSLTEVRNTLVYVLLNYRQHGNLAIGTGILNPNSSACGFDGWLDWHVTFLEKARRQAEDVALG